VYSCCVYEATGVVVRWRLQLLSPIVPSLSPLAAFQSKNELHAIVGSFKILSGVHIQSSYGSDLGRVIRTPDETRVLIVPFVPRIDKTISRAR
jgi:hypothetical protein